jgi:hypothetical protein
MAEHEPEALIKGEASKIGSNVTGFCGTLLANGPDSFTLYPVARLF